MTRRRFLLGGLGALSWIGCPPVLRAEPARPAPGSWQDAFAGVPITGPDGRRKLYPDPARWAFAFRPGLIWHDSFGDGTNWLDANGECQVYLSALSKPKGLTRLAPERLYDPFHIEPDGLHIRAGVLDTSLISALELRAGRVFGSGVMISREAFLYGSVTVCARVPSARGSWAALWMLPISGQWPPEIDVFEAMCWGRRTRQIHAGLIAPPDTGETYGDWFAVDSDPSADFHTYTLNWTEKSIAVGYDRQILFERPTPSSMQQPMYILMNLAVGGRWPANELGIPPHDGMDSARFARLSDMIRDDYPDNLVIKYVSYEST